MDTALTVFILICASMVLFMTPGVAFFYGGLSRKKNVGNTIIMAFLAIGVCSVVLGHLGVLDCLRVSVPSRLGRFHRSDHWRFRSAVLGGH